MQDLVGSLGTFGTQAIEALPTVAAAVGALVVGWIVALVAAALVRGGMRRTGLDEKIRSALGNPDRSSTVDSAQVGGKLTFWFVMAFAVMAFFQLLNLTGVTEPMNAALGVFSTYVPRVLGAGVLVAVAWFVATVGRRLARALLEGSGLAARLDQISEGGASQSGVSGSLSEVVYWLVWLLFLPAILGTLAIEGLLAPVQGVVDQLLGFAPKFLGAAVILAIGWFVAKLVRKVVVNLLRALGLDAIGEKAGMPATNSVGGLPGLLGLVAYVLILVPVAVSALGALQMEALTGPATAMLARMLDVIPSLFAAAVLLGLAFIVGKLIAELVGSALAGVGFDNLMASIGLSTSTVGGRSASSLAASVVHFAILLFAAMESASVLGFDSLLALMEQIAVFGGQLLLALVIMGVALYLSGLASDAIRNMRSPMAPQLATVARVVILALAGAMALQQMNVGGEIITLAFGSAMGAVAVASAIAFGLGGREVARRHLESWTGVSDTSPTPKKFGGTEQLG